jgi:2-oxoisovalerate dehydrogenase E1 component beta subunit
MPTMNMIQALNDAHRVAMRKDEDVVVFGEDAGYFGGVFRVTEGLQREFGKTRVFDSPISEGGIVAAAVGMAAYGIRPVVEIQFADYIYPGYDQIVSEVAKMRYRTAGEWPMPMVIRSPYGGGIFGGQTHSQSPESLFTHIAGLKVVIPSTPYDAKGLLIAAIEDPEGHYVVPLGKAAIVREGADLTILAYGTMVHVALAAVESQGIDAEVIDLRTLLPLDIAAIEQSVRKTGRCLVVQEAPRTSGFASELAALVQERCFYHLEAPVERVTGWDTPYPHAYEWAYFPGPKRLKKALEKVMAD